jgi:hypothetical protein
MKLKIDTDNLVEEFFENTCLIGIVAPIKDYTFIWHINQALGYQFQINHSSEIQLRKKDRNYFFSIYQYNLPSSQMTHLLYNNHDDGEYLLPEFKHLDYLWLARGEIMQKEEVKNLLAAIRTIKEVSLVTELTIEKIKNKLSLII